jgi:hypothetical protein
VAKEAALQAQRQDLGLRIDGLVARRDAALRQALPVDDVKALCAQVAVGLDQLTFEERRNMGVE